jgi:HEPN domain-containing protein
MPHEESLYPPDWLRIAEADWRRARRMMEDNDAAAAGFFLQQSVEKFLKAFLLSKGWRLVRTHDLEALLNDALPHFDALEEFRDECIKISGYYMAERYPPLTENAFSVEDVRQSVAAVERMVELLRAKISK